MAPHDKPTCLYTLGLTLPWPHFQGLLQEVAHSEISHTEMSHAVTSLKLEILSFFSLSFQSLMYL